MKFVKNQNREITITILKWVDWINAQYREWRGDSISREKSISKFAAEIGVSPQLLWEWLNRGTYPKSSTAVNKLVKYFGSSRLREIEDISLYTWPTDDLLQPIAELIAMLPEDQKHAVREAFAYTVIEGEGHTPNEITEILLRRINENLNNK